MQNYMISSRKKNGAFSTETVEDRAAQDFRNLVRKRGKYRKQKKAGGLMYAASACLVLVIIIMGVSMVNSFDRMKSVQSTLETLADRNDTMETQETSGSVTAITSEEQTGKGQEEGTAETDQTEKDAGQSDQDQTIQNEENSADAGQKIEEETGTKTDSGETSSADESQTKNNTSKDANGSDGVYIVEEGDTLAIISRKMYGDVTHVDAICRMNGITDGNLIYVGQKLLLP